jgi:hypothetical protein
MRNRVYFEIFRGFMRGLKFSADKRVPIGERQDGTPSLDGRRKTERRIQYQFSQPSNSNYVIQRWTAHHRENEQHHRGHARISPTICCVHAPSIACGETPPLRAICVRRVFLMIPL